MRIFFCLLFFSSITLGSAITYTHDNYVIEDFFAMAQCDYLIRSASLYTRAVLMIGNHKIVMYPIHGKWNKEKEMPIMNPIGIVIRS